MTTATRSLVFTHIQRPLLGAIGTPRRYALVDSDNGDSSVKPRCFAGHPAHAGEAANTCYFRGGSGS